MNIPTKITFSRIILIVGMLIGLFVLNIVGLNTGFKSPAIFGGKVDLVFFIVCIIFIIASLTDFLDGYLARKWHQVTSLGKFLDPVADKLLINTLAIFLIAPQFFAPYAVTQTASMSAWVVIILVARDIVVDCMRFVAAQKNVVVAANIFGKLKTVLEMITITVVLLNGWPFSYFDASWIKGLHINDFLQYITALASLLSGIIYIVENRHVFKDEKEKQ